MGITADKIADLVSTVSAEPSQWTTLTPAERLTVALILDKIDWLRADGFKSVSAARNRLGPEWWQAMQEVKGGLFRTAWYFINDRCRSLAC